MHLLCETFIPLMAVALLWAGARSPRPPWEIYAGCLAAAGLVYLLTWADRRQGWWAGWGLDFSTHAGIATVLVVALSFHGRRWLAAGASTLACYGAVMVRLGYHSWGDLATAVAAVLPLALACALAARALFRRSDG